MTLGENIHKLRMAKGMTQKQLADQLFVTSQAVSRWENNEVEPNINVLNKMAEIFDVTVDAIINGPNEQPVEVKEEIKIKENVANCHDCHKAIFDGEAFKKVERFHYEGSGRSRRRVCEIVTLCEDCYQKQIAEDEAKTKKAYEDKLRSLKNRRIWAYCMGALAGIIFLLIFIFGTKNLEFNLALRIVGSIISLYGGFSLVYCLIWETYIQDVFLTIAGFGFVKFPGIIFEFSIDGFIGLIVLKIIFVILGYILAAIAIIFAIIICMVLAIFSFPFYTGKIKAKPEDINI